ncbi:Retrovirus-related Pol polyprotein, partial [Mucuna pruriens]
MHRSLMEEEAKPIRQQQTRLNPTILDVVKKEVTKLLVAGIIYPISDSQWVSPVQVVPKKFGMTIMKNQQDELETRKDHFPLPFIDQVLEKLSGKSHYCFMDGFSRYMQIHIAPEDQHKTTFTCPFGTFAYTHMSFGLCNAPSTFQHCMISIFSNLLQECMEVFMDDFTVYADSFYACLENLSKVLTRCIDTNLVLNFEKCHFMVTEGIVLGHLVSNKGIKEVRSFLGHAGFYRRFIKNFNKIALQLSKLLQKDLNYTTKKELLAIVFALDKFRSYLLSSKIVVFSDHAALRFLLKKSDAKARLIRWMLLLQEFNIEIRDKKGAENSIVDHLTRIERNEDLHLSFHRRHLSFTRKNSRAMPNTTYGMILTYGDFAVTKCIPNTEINSVLQFCHAALGGGHYGSTWTARKVLDCGFYWTTIFRDAHQLVSTCKKCQKAGMAISRRHVMPQQPILFCEVFDVWGIYFMGPLLVSNWYSYILLAIDYVEAIATKSNDAKAVVDFLKSNIFYQFGVPKVLISDQGSHFCNRVMSSLLHKYEVVHRIATTYHPQTNG